jgi:hypothetical protein
MLGSWKSPAFVGPSHYSPFPRDATLPHDFCALAKIERRKPQGICAR